MSKIKFKRPVIIDGALFGKGNVGEFEIIDWFIKALLSDGTAEVIEESERTEAPTAAKKVTAGAGKRK